MSKFNNLPGIEVNIADGGLMLPEDRATDSMLIIAPSLELTAPQEPVLIRESAALTNQGFGGFTDANGVVNPIAQAWKAAFEGGCRQIYLMALQGKTETEKFSFLQNSFFGILADFSVSHVAIVGATSDVEAADLKVEQLTDEHQDNFPGVPGVVRYGYVVESASVLAEVEILAATNDTITINGESITLSPADYDGTEGKTTNDLVADITAQLVAVEALENFQATLVNGKLLIVGDIAFQIEEGTALEDLDLPIGNAIKRKNDKGLIYQGNFAKLLADYTENQTSHHNAMLGYIGVKGPEGNSLAQIKAQVDRLAKLENEYSGNVQVVAGPELGYRVPNTNSIYYTNGVITYASLMTRLRPESAPTNKPVGGVSAAYYNLSLRQLNTLTGNKFITFRIKNARVMVTDGITTAPDLVIGGQRRSSDFTRISTVRITQAAVQLVREITEPFVGEPNRMPQYNALKASLKGALEAMKNQGALNDYRFSVVARGSTLNEAVVTLELVPAFELRRITVNVSLRSDLQ
jgi:hypothetical protein